MGCTESLFKKPKEGEQTNAEEKTNNKAKESKKEKNKSTKAEVAKRKKDKKGKKGSKDESANETKNGKGPNSAKVRPISDNSAVVTRKLKSYNELYQNKNKHLQKTYPNQWHLMWI